MAVKMSDADFQLVSRSIVETWQAVGHDVIQACEEAGEPLDNETAVESCIDADRLLDFSNKGKEAYAILRPLYESNSYNAVLNYLSRKIRLGA